MLQSSTKIPTLDQIKSSQSCTNCSHLPVCTIFRAVASLLSNWEKDKPMQPENLAKICAVFESNTIATILRDQE